MSSELICIFLTILNIVLWTIFIKRQKKKHNGIDDIAPYLNNLIKQIQNETERNVTLVSATKEGLQKLLDDAKRFTELANAEFAKHERSQEIINFLQSEYNTEILKNEQKRNDYSPQKTLDKKSKETIDVTFGLDSITKNMEDSVSISDEASALMKKEKGTDNNDLPKITKASTQIIVKKDFKTKVLELAATGFSTDVIASKLGKPISEVQCIINMHMNMNT